MKSPGAPSRWPSHCDIFGYLREQNRAIGLDELVKRVGYSEHCTQRAVRELHALGIIHIAKWRPAEGGGFPAKLWKCWPRKDAEKPPLASKKQSRLKWYRKTVKTMTDLYGHSVARKVLTSRKYGGADKIVIDGKTIYERQPRSGRPARRSA